jgi:hypothetical protein
MKQKLLTDIELDVHELKYLMVLFSEDHIQEKGKKRNQQLLRSLLLKLL